MYQFFNGDISTDIKICILLINISVYGVQGNKLITMQLDRRTWEVFAPKFGFISIPYRYRYREILHVGEYSPPLEC